MKNRSKKRNHYQYNNRFSIRKFNIGVASIAVSSVAIAGMMFFGNANLVYAEEGNTDFNRTGTGNSTVIDTKEFVMVTHVKPDGNVEDVAILKSDFSENLEKLKKNYPGLEATSLEFVSKNTYKIIYRAQATTNTISETSTTPRENKVSLQGHLVGNQTEYNVGEQIISTFRLDVSAPSKLEDGSYILVN